MEYSDTGILLNKNNILLHRKYFKEMTRLIGINVLYRSPKEGMKSWDSYGELDAAYNPPILEGVIFEEHPTIWTMKKLGWNAEQQDDPSIIHVRYDLEGLQVGALFIIPSGIDNSQGRVFRVMKMSTTQVYPASIACMLAPEWESTEEKTSTEDFSKSNFNVLYDGEEDED